MSSDQYLTATIVQDEDIPFGINNIKWSRLSSIRKKYLLNLHQDILKMKETYNIDYTYLQYINQLSLLFSYKSNNKMYKRYKIILTNYGNVWENKHENKYKLSILI